ncbi:carboxylesterase/lipase family protein [Natrinema halophilum]|uniref:Carboxylesterase family protein n=1 Tax=Natrinema halophilum TaxID=1699371 RepID=A0A7D5GIW7_9EURY|nr:carboxylesterase family protein [Natrinema halophilum]QLG47352.1 carboxylesterase family protein [Natrinema halophilum]
MDIRRRPYVRALLAGVTVGATSGIGSSTPKFSPKAMTESGPVSGVQVGPTNVYKGIPYAKQPIDDRRWRPPEIPAEWDGILEATEYGPECVQSGGLSQITGGDSSGISGSEACLNLNVWTPVDATSDDPRPVMVWIHGGGYTTGNNRYDSRTLSAFGDVVVVAINYRLGPFGFFTHPDLLAENSRNVNQGYQDIRAALRWVQRNVRAFGGDPDNVTVFGESAGGNAVLTLMTDPETEGLFHRVICQSGPAISDLSTREEAAEAGVAIATELGCTGRDAAGCLREKSPEAILNAGSSNSSGNGVLDGPLGVVVDGEVIVENPARRFFDGEFHDVPLLTGGNDDETQLFLLQDAVPTDDAYETAIRERYGELADAVLEAYPAEAYETPKKALIDATTDSAFLCRDRLVAQWIDENGGTVYRYLFDDTPTHPLVALPWFADDVGAYHAAELPYVFGRAVPEGEYAAGQIGSSDRLLSRRIRDYWTTFAETGNPNSDRRPAWPEFTASEQRQIRLTETEVIPQCGTKDECVIWYPGYRRHIGFSED